MGLVSRLLLMTEFAANAVQRTAAPLVLAQVSLVGAHLAFQRDHVCSGVIAWHIGPAERTRHTAPVRANGGRRQYRRAKIACGAGIGPWS